MKEVFLINILIKFTLFISEQHKVFEALNNIKVKTKLINHFMVV
jgi:hypothetical protein